MSNEIGFLVASEEISQLKDNAFGIFKLSRKTISDTLIDAIIENTSVTHYVFYENSIGDEMAIRLANALAKKKSVHSIFFWANLITDYGAGGIAKALANANIIHLDLTRNLISDKGALRFALEMTKYSRLASLDFSHNQIGDSGCIALANAIGKTLFLSKVNLSYNHITNKGTKAWIQCLKKTRYIYSVNLNGNPIDPEMLVVLKSVADINEFNREALGAKLLKLSRILMRLRKKVPLELFQIIFKCQSSSLTPWEIKTLLQVMFKECYVGWIHSSLRYTTNELIQRCTGLLFHKLEFEKLNMLVVQRRVAVSEYSTLLKKINTETRIIKSAVVHPNHFIWEPIVTLISILINTIPFVYRNMLN